MNRQKLLLLILAVLLVLAVVYAYFHRPQQATVERPKQHIPGTSVVDGRRREAAAGEQNKLNLALLDRPMPHFTGFKRNIFWFAPVVTQKKLPPPPPPPLLKPSPPPPPPPPPSPQSIATMEMAKFQFLGFLKKDNKKTIFLHKDNEIILVKKGDKIANKYEVTSITDDALIINSTLGGGQIVIPLVENKPLAPR
jgi:hypothetical protein